MVTKRTVNVDMFNLVLCMNFSILYINFRTIERTTTNTIVAHQASNVNGFKISFLMVPCKRGFRKIKNILKILLIKILLLRLKGKYTLMDM